MASVVINTRFNNRKAEADLKELQAKAKETAREINAVEKGLGSATTKRNKLRDDLEAARQKAAETAAALDEVNARLDAGRKSKFGVTSKGDETLSDKLAAKLQQQDTAVQAAADAYHAQDGVQLHCAAGGVLYRAHNLRQRRSSQGYERRRIGGGQRSEEGQGR